MKNKKTGVNSKNQIPPKKKNSKAAKIPAGKGKDFGGIPDIDPKKFLGCG